MIIRRAISHPVVGRAAGVRQLEARWGPVVPVPAAVCTEVVGVAEVQVETVGAIGQALNFTRHPHAVSVELPERPRVVSGAINEVGLRNVKLWTPGAVVTADCVRMVLIEIKVLL